MNLNFSLILFIIKLFQIRITKGKLKEIIFMAEETSG